MSDLNRSFTVADVMRRRPCSEYSLGRVRELWAGRESLTLLEILDLDIQVRDRLWVALQTGVLPDEVLTALACDFAERVLPVWECWASDHAPERLDHPRICIEVRRRHLRGEASDEELAEAVGKAARAAGAAWVAGDAVAAVTARAARAYGAAWAARAAGAAGAAEAARAADAAGAAWAARAAGAAGAAEAEWQLERVRQHVRGEATV